MAEAFADLMKAARKTPEDLAYELRRAGLKTTMPTVDNWRTGRYSPSVLPPRIWIPLLESLGLPVSREGIERLSKAIAVSEAEYAKKRTQKYAKNRKYIV